MTVAEFLATGTLLLREITAVDSTDTSETGVVFWLEKYEALAIHLGSSTAEVERACWKISQDVLIRLRRLKDGGSGESKLEDLHSVFPGQDIEVLRTRLFDIQTRWQSLRQPDLEERGPEDDGALDLPDAYATLSIVEEDVLPDSTRYTVSEELLRQYILDNLSFESMEHREQDVSTAHGKSFAWIFDEPSHGDSEASGPEFAKWLSTNELGSVYWITGKPGSGKSTLMRYLSEHSQTKKHLQTWAGEKQVAVAGFYFWVSGSEDQRSRVGLLRSLLYRLLSLHPDLIPAAFPSLWAKLSQMTTKQRIGMGLEWTGPDLTSGFLRLLEAFLPRANICLFIDGLDELDGDHESMVRFFRDMVAATPASRASQVKLCLSSRPWRVFARAFAHTVPHLQLQELIRGDMGQYARDSLAKHGFQTAATEKTVREIVNRADGVFLWTRLVVKEITQRFGGGGHGHATAEEIQSFVTRFPSDLSQLFEKLVFEDQTQTQLVYTAQLFRLVHAQEVVAAFVKNESSTSLSVWELAFASRGAPDDNLVLTRTVAEATGEEIMDRVRQTISWVRQSSAGLLDLFPRRAAHNHHQEELEAMARMFAGYMVTYLHRTVRDWLLYPAHNHIWQRLLEASSASPSSSSFDPHLRLLRSYVLRLKFSLEEIEHHRRLDEWYPSIALSLTHARHIQIARGDPAGKLQKKLVDELDRTISWYWLTKTSRLQDHWALDRFGGYEGRGNLVIPHPFLALCTRYGLERYVLETLEELAAQCESREEEEEKKTDAKMEGTPLLHRALEFLCSRQKTIYPLSSPSFIQGLLQAAETYKAHPTLGPLIGSLDTVFSAQLIKVQEPTPWIMVLRHVRDAKRRGWIESFDIGPHGTERWTRIVEMLVLQGGADREAVVKGDIWDAETNAEGVFGRGRMLAEYGDWWVEDRLGKLF